ncbi:MAG: small ribosomal subunit Rsm22 family protein [Bdellovibrionia bacterium]
MRDQKNRPSRSGFKILSSPQTPKTQFPPAWLWLVDEAIPTWVKKTYSPKETWKDKPFSNEDAGFFFRGIEELSELFTEERSRGLANYFNHPKFRSSYLLYFLPLQAAKFLTLYQLHPQAIEAAVSEAETQGVMRIVDLGAGPGTASLSLLLFLLGLKIPEERFPKKIQLDWFDTQAGIMTDGKALAEQLASHFPKLRGRLEVHTHCQPWWKATDSLLGSGPKPALILMGHVLNESSLPQKEQNEFWHSLMKAQGGGGVLWVEPAARRPSQGLSQLRDLLFESETLPQTPTRIWGPCLHAGACPLSSGRDWCHFSTSASIPGVWFRKFSEGLGSERHWLKFSYLWVSSEQYPAPQPAPRLRRVVSDPLDASSGRPTLLLCEPQTVKRWSVTQKTSIGRGDLFQIDP